MVIIEFILFGAATRNLHQERILTMLTNLFWVEGPWPGRMAISPRPRGGDWLDDEMKGWRQAGVDAVVSLLESDEAQDLGLDRERKYCEANDMDFHSLPIVDRSVPNSDVDAARLLSELEEVLDHGKNCRQGLGRAGLIASTLLVERGLNPSEAVERVSAARHAPVPETAEQLAWIEAFAATLNQQR
jgi:protein-tyrosine phosphatase